MTTRQERRQIVLELVNRNEVTSQEQLQDLLSAEGIQATQATISRDLRDLGVIKAPSPSGGPPVYALVDFEHAAGAESKELILAIQADVHKIDRAAAMLVLKTSAGSAAAVADRLDRSTLPQIVGVMGSGDTVFIATRSSGQAGELRRILERLRA